MSLSLYYINLIIGFQIMNIEDLAKTTINDPIIRCTYLCFIQEEKIL